MTARRVYSSEVLAEVARVCCDALGPLGEAVSARFAVGLREARRRIAAARTSGFVLPTPPVVRLPFAALEAAAGRENLLVLAAALGSDTATLYRYRNQGVPVFTADRLAVKLGMHPCQVWPDWYQVAA